MIYFYGMKLVFESDWVQRNCIITSLNLTRLIFSTRICFEIPTHDKTKTNCFLEKFAINNERKSQTARKPTRIIFQINPDKTRTGIFFTKISFFGAESCFLALRWGFFQDPYPDLDIRDRDFSLRLLEKPENFRKIAEIILKISCFLIFKNRNFSGFSRYTRYFCGMSKIGIFRDFRD